MAIDTTQSKEIDLDRTDKLPILQGISIDEDVEDDSVRLDYSALGGPAISPSTSEFSRPSALDLPSLADSVRSVEERIARQNADYEALNRQFEKARDAQLAAGTRADTLASELASAQAALAVEQHRRHGYTGQIESLAHRQRAYTLLPLRDGHRSYLEDHTLGGEEALGRHAK